MPITGIKLVGDFSIQGSFRDEREEVLTQFTNPKGVHKAKSMWAAVEQDFNLNILNNQWPQGGYKRGGVLAIGYVQGLEAFKDKDLILSKDAINVVYTNNVASDYVPMTGWILAHRMCHAITCRPSYVNLDRAVHQSISEALSSYNLEIKSRDWSGFTVLDELPRGGYELANALLTMKSARERRLRQALELLPELITQYLMKGEITFNTAPEILEIVSEEKSFFNYDTEKMLEKTCINTSEVDAIFAKLRETLRAGIPPMFDDLVGKVLIF